jgi:FKBP-type peptidyl-prolyl cis-trans isomerase
VVSPLAVTDHKGKSLTTRKGFRLQRAKTFDGMKFALDYLKVGQRAQFVVSSIFAYNQNEWKTPPSLGAKPFLPAKSVLVCDVELLDVHKFGDKM